MFLLIFIFSSIFSLDLSLGLLFENAYYFGVQDKTISSYGFIGEMKKRIEINDKYYLSYGGAYTYHSLNNSFKDNSISEGVDGYVYESLGLTTVDLLLEFGREFSKNIISSSLYFGIASAKYSGMINKNLYSRRDEGYTYAINFNYGRYLNKFLIAKLGVMYRGVDDTSPQSFDFLTALLLF